MTVIIHVIGVVKNGKNMQTRRDFIKRITALVASIPVIGLSTGIYAEHIQSVNISTKLGREPVLELGSKKPYKNINE
jgi:hypothetical protein